MIVEFAVPANITTGHIYHVYRRILQCYGCFLYMYWVSFSDIFSALNHLSIHINLNKCSDAWSSISHLWSIGDQEVVKLHLLAGVPRSANLGWLLFLNGVFVRKICMMWWHNSGLFDVILKLTQHWCSTSCDFDN